MVVSSGGNLSPKATTTTTTAANTTPDKPTPQIKIDLAQSSDAAAIARLGAQCFSATFGPSVPAADLAAFLAATYTPEAIRSDLLDARQTTFAARSVSGSGEHVVVGFVQLVRGESARGVPGPDLAAHAELRRLYVDARAHGRGVGSRLIAAVEERARAEGFAQLWLSVWEDNAHARGLYERRGYARVGELDFATGGCVQTDWVLAKAL